MGEPQVPQNTRVTVAAQVNYLPAKEDAESLPLLPEAPADTYSCASPVIFVGVSCDREEEGKAHLNVGDLGEDVGGVRPAGGVLAVEACRVGFHWIETQENEGDTVQRK